MPDRSIDPLNDSVNQPPLYRQYFWWGHVDRIGVWTQTQGQR